MRSAPSPDAPGRRAWLLPSGLAALAVVLLRLPFLGADAGRDEAGYLIVGTGWHDGTSLYGDYWVDRPPLLLWVFQAAGDLTTLRLLGCVAAALVVLLTGAAAHVAAGARAVPYASGAAALLCASPWLGTVRVNGELLAAPFVAASMLATVLLVRRSAGARVAAGAGASAAAAVLVKQSTVDALVFGVVALVVLATRSRASRRRAAGLLLAAVASALATVGVVLALAALRGTYPADLWDAVVRFRVDAGETIRLEASDATGERLLVLVATWAVSGLAMLTAGVAALAWVRRRDPVVVATLASLVASSGVALLGGSYWAHYLIQLVPAAALAAGLVAVAVPRGWRRAGAVALVGAAAVTIGATVVSPDEDGREARLVGEAIGGASRPGDTAVVAYGQPNVLLAAGTRSPYPYLWSLPVRTLDPELSALRATLASDDAPTWLVEWSGFDTWGVDADRLLPLVTERYREVARVCGRTVWLDRAVERPPVPSRSCA